MQEVHKKDTTQIIRKSTRSLENMKSKIEIAFLFQVAMKGLQA
jgi:hypothetical protein